MMRYAMALLVVGIAVALLLLGCKSSGGAAQAAEEVRSSAARATAGNVPAADLDAVVAGNTEFAVALYHQLKKEPKNLFYSPHSISLALAMTYAGARGNTEKQMAQTLHFSLPQDRLHAAFNRLDQELGREVKLPQYVKGQTFRLNIASSLFGQQGYQFHDAFLGVLGQNYGAGMQLLDFSGAPEPSRQTINKWIEDKTEGKIKDLVPPGAIHNLTRLVLANAIYFLASWNEPFQERQTREEDFNLLDGQKVKVPMMRQTESFDYTEGADYQAVEMLYVDRKMSMVILLPRPGKFEAVEGQLTAQGLSQILAGLRPREVALTMPRFKFSSTLPLNDVLIGMGMQDAFDANRADFSGMTDAEKLFIGAVLHGACVAVDEKGTEAAAATVVAIAATSFEEPPPPVSMIVDRPFIFLIRDTQTKAILFVGRVLDPSA